jgi:tRNA (guanine37-N1)-methyltransferase
MRLDFISLFPEMLKPALSVGVVGRAVDKGAIKSHYWNPRDYTTNKHRTVDDRPFGGGPGMLMLPQPLDDCIVEMQQQQQAAGVKQSPIIYLSPQGRRLDQALVKELSALPAITLLCGRYEGVDERLLEKHVSIEVSIGDYVLSGGELPALVVADAVARQLPGVLGHEDSAEQDSFANGLLDCPHYTRPAEWQGREVPPVLLSGDHAAIAEWRQAQSIKRTNERRPDLLSMDNTSKPRSSGSE